VWRTAIVKVGTSITAVTMSSRVTKPLTMALIRLLHVLSPNRSIMDTIVIATIQIVSLE
jgi:hypothetical protein